MQAAALVPPGVRLRPLPLSELFDEVFRLYRRRFLLLWAASLFQVVPGVLAGASAVAIAAAFGVFTDNAGQFAGAPGTAELAAAGLGLLLALASAPVALFLLWRASLAAVMGEPVGLGAILQDVTRAYWRLWLLSLGYGGLVLVCGFLFLTCLLSPLGIWLYIKWSLTVPAWFAERHALGPSLSRSWALTDRNWWRLLGILLLFSVLTSVVGAALGSFTLFAAFVPREWTFAATIVQLITRQALSTFTAPLLPLVLTLLYLDLRVRHEHLDLEVMARRLVTAEPEWVLPPAAPAPPPPAFAPPPVAPPPMGPPA